jgi:hypothetical protein
MNGKLSGFLSLKRRLLSRTTIAFLSADCQVHATHPLPCRALEISSELCPGRRTDISCLGELSFSPFGSTANPSEHDDR